MSRRASEGQGPHRVPVRDLPHDLVLAGLYSVAGPPEHRWPERYAGDLTSEHLRHLVAAAPQGLSVERGRVLECRIADGVLDAAIYDLHNGGGQPLARAIVEELRWARSKGLLADFPDPDGYRMVAEMALGELERIDPARACRIAVADDREVSTDIKMRFFADIDLLAEGRDLSGTSVAAVIDRAERDLRMLRTAWVTADNLVRAGTDPLVAFRRTAAGLDHRFRNRLRAAHPESPERDGAILRRAWDRLKTQCADRSPEMQRACWNAFPAELPAIAADGISATMVALRSSEPPMRGGLGG